MVAVVDDILRAVLDGEIHQLFLGGLVSGDEELPLLAEEVGQRAGRGEVAAVLGEGGAYLAGRAVLVVGGDLDDDADAAGAVPFVEQFEVFHAGQLAGALLDRPVDVVGWHVGGFRLVDHRAQARIEFGIAAAVPRGERQILGDGAEDLAALGVNGGLVALGGRPFAMT